MPLLSIAKRAASIFSARGARFLGAAVAFYALLSAAPLFVLVLEIVGSIFGKARAEDALWQGLGEWLAPDGIATVRGLTERLDKLESGGSILGIFLVVYGSTRLFRALRRALNQLWGIDLEAVERKRSSAKKYGVRYGGAFALALFVALLVTLLVLVKSAFAFIATMSLRAPPSILWVLDGVISIAIAFILFTVVFRFLPETKVSLKEAAASAAVSTALFAIGSELVTIYIGHKNVGDVYAGASAVVLAVVWVYYSAQVFFFGACIGLAMREAKTADA